LSSLTQPHFEIVKCDTGFTLRESLSGQLMHSSIGPWAEANTVYVEPSNFERRLGVQSDAPLVLYDVGMGTAANVVAVLEKCCTLTSARKGRSLEIISFERYPEALAQIVAEGDVFKYLTPYRETLHTLLQNKQVKIGDKISWKLLPGIFQELDLTPLPPADLIYFDFYSPATCPELWTRSLFKKLHEKSTPDINLITYAAGKSARSAMLLAGFFVGTGRSTEMKLETTIAATQIEALEKPLTLDWLKSLERSAKPFPLDIPPHHYNEAMNTLKRHSQFSA
jgi:tRNA U34 5-methylaminomethyl-2-thiouridine-forming methyltransferase MnmC